MSMQPVTKPDGLPHHLPIFSPLQFLWICLHSFALLVLFRRSWLHDLQHIPMTMMMPRTKKNTQECISSINGIHNNSLFQDWALWQSTQQLKFNQLLAGKLGKMLVGGHHHPFTAALMLLWSTAIFYCAEVAAQGKKQGVAALAVLVLQLHQQQQQLGGGGQRAK